MKYISRIEQVDENGWTNFCWTLRILMGSPYQHYKTFTDGVYGGQEEALEAAILHRDKYLTKHKKAIERYGVEI